MTLLPATTRARSIDSVVSRLSSQRIASSSNSSQQRTLVSTASRPGQSSQQNSLKHHGNRSILLANTARGHRSWVRVRSSQGVGSARIPLTSSVYGTATSRGTRPYQEDSSSISCLEIPPSQLRSSLQRGGRIATEAERRWKWKSQEEGLDQELASQVNWWGIFDGHGGTYPSLYLSTYLHQIFEKVTPDMVTDTVQKTREHGGYFRRFVGGNLERWVRKEELKAVRGGKAGKRPGEQAKKEEQEATTQAPDTSEEAAPGPGHEADRVQAGQEPVHAAADGEQTKPSGSAPGSKPPSAAIWDDNGLTQRIPVPEGMEEDSLTLSERATLAFLVADRHILTHHPQANGVDLQPSHDERGIQTREADAERAAKGKEGGGSTASVLTLHSIDAPPNVWYDSDFLMLGAWHVGDTRMLLCPTQDGQAVPLTTLHHPDTASESDRLRRLGAGVVTDSFGEARWMGALANTRALGDGSFKAAGVTAEPELLSQVIRGTSYSHVTMISDGISSVMSDQEVLDLARGCDHPKQAAKKILEFAETLGVEDNATVVVVPLKGWGKIGGEDTTKAQREYRQSKIDIFRDSRR